MTFFVGGVLPYLTIVLFLAGFGYQLFAWKRLPAPKMTLTPAPAPGAPRFWQAVKETFFFTRLFREDKSLWLLGWVFHALLALIFIGHMRVISWLPDRTLEAIGMKSDQIRTMSTVVGGAAGLALLVFLLLLLVRRQVKQNVKEISTSGDYLALLLLLAIVLTGDAMRFFTNFELSQTREYFHALVTFSSVSILIPENGWFLMHFLLGQVLIIYIPFSKILHLGGVFFTLGLVHRH